MDALLRYLILEQITEYYVIRRGHYRVADLYSASKDGWYFYTYGINLRFVVFANLLFYSDLSSRAFAAYIAGILINVVGFAGASTRFVSNMWG